MEGNICIAGHNYDNRLFFSKISSLSSNDVIYIFDNDGSQYLYIVYDIYEVPSSDLSPVLNYEKSEKTLTLVTCNNFNNNRIIVKAKQLINRKALINVFLDIEKVCMIFLIYKKTLTRRVFLYYIFL